MSESVEQAAPPVTNDPALHAWVKVTAAEPSRCSKCGTYYATEKGAKPCPAGREAA